MRNSGAAPWLTEVAYGNGVFVAVGQGGWVMRSVDAVNWVAADSGTTRYLSAVSFADGQFVAAGQRGKVLSSADGIDWISGNLPVGNWLYTVSRANDVWVVAGFAGAVYSSCDLLTWDPEAIGESGDYFGSCEGGGNLLLVGLLSPGGGAVARATTLPPSAPPLAVQLVGGEDGGGTVITYSLPVEGPAWDTILVLYSDDLQTWTPLGSEPVLTATDSGGDHYQVIDPGTGGQVGARYYRADFTLLGD